ncbi:tetratricopeptide repeat protein [Pseudomonas syringae]|uniref:Tetratricopeptide repeat protein n=1 Tax=Pseudomonas syringae TaxID=317 RepID=A0A1C7Z825_PSESX|nr:tetratricopeptide repeat protein [Pseudomonas syringae]OCR25206.1 tetratricopeptide repeat protein [Pseudomonas syringae]
MKTIIIGLACGLLSLPLWALDAPDQQRLAAIQQEWAHVQYEVPAPQRPDAFEKLAAQTSSFVQARPQAAEAWIWSGIVTSSWAGAQGGLGALSKVKQAKADLEKALSLDPKALQGSAYISLAALYDRVPGWPLGFGDADKAGQLLEQGLKLNPDGIDPLYFWGDHLYRQGHYAQARDELNRALQAAPRPGREKADAGRRQEIGQLLADVEKKLK